MRQTMRQIFSLLILVCAMRTAINAQTLTAGVARVDITPPAGVELWGYSNRSGPATGSLDPLYARALLLDDGRNAVAIVTLDLGRTFGQAQMNTVRERARREHRVNDVMFIASHTHSGPSIDEDYENGALPDWERRALDRIAQAIGDARGRMVEARIGVGFGQTIIGHNRRVVQSDGSVKMLWRNSTGQTGGPIDPTVGVIRVDGKQGDPIAILVNYACHPVVFGPDNLRYSADFPGAMARLVERSFAGDQNNGQDNGQGKGQDKGPICFFLQGAPGDINPMMDKTPLDENADAEMIRVGEQLGREVVRVGRSIKTEAAPNPEVAYLSEEVSFKNRWRIEALREMILTAYGPTYGPKGISRYQRYMKDPILALVSTLFVNRQIALVGLPG